MVPLKEGLGAQPSRRRLSQQSRRRASVAAEGHVAEGVDLSDQGTLRLCEAGRWG